MSTIEILDSEIYNQMSKFDENDFNSHVNIMSLIDYRYHINDTPEQYNTRLRNKVSENFNKIGLSEHQKDCFRVWESNLIRLPTNASRGEIFNCAPQESLYTVGF